MDDPRALLQTLRAAIEAAPALPERGAWLAQLDAALAVQAPAATNGAAAPAATNGAAAPAATNGAAAPAATDAAPASGELTRLRQDVEDAEHARDAANLQRMKVAGQLGTLQKALAAAAPNVDAGKDAQSAALKRIEWLAHHGGDSPQAAEAARAAEMDAPMPSRAVLEAVIAGERKFNKAQLEFSIAEAMVLTGWAQTPLELVQQGEPWLAELILKNQTDAA